jgi:5-methylthioribose kinase
MLVLSTDNALEYLRERGWIGPGPADITPLSGGVSSVVLRVEQGERRFVLKQACPQLRTRDDWFSDLARSYREQEVMRILGPLLPTGFVPEVLHSDTDNYVFAMSHAPLDARVWKQQLLAGEVDLAVGAVAGRALGRLHDATARQPELVEPFRDPAVFVQLRVDPFYRRVQERRPEVADAIAPLIEGLLSRSEALCHGDFSPKNLLVSAARLTLVDYETAYFGDPAMDLGFFLSHLVLKACKRAGERSRYFDLTRAFWAGYAEEMTFRPLDEMQRRGIAHAGVCVLARIDGTSPVDYLPQEQKRELARRLGRGLLLERPAAWEDALLLAERELA